MPQERQLAAIMFTDIVGYTALMERDEKLAISLRNRHRDTFEMTTDAFNGKIVQYFGDGTLSIFKSTVEAVECAVEMQSAFLKEPQIPVRIGVHVGDIIHSKDDIIGDAVNVASRIESCAVAGSILISDKVHDQIRSHRHIKSKFLDAYEFKNIETAIPIFAIANEGLKVPVASKLKGKFKDNFIRESQKTSSKKKNMIFGAIGLFALLLFSYFQFFQQKRVIENQSIAVLPFINLSQDKDAEIFRDGMTDDILTNLSKIKELHVSSRISVMRYKNTKKSISEIAKELGVEYLLEGSIRKYGNKIRVTAQLINANSDELLLSENYDKTITDIFAIQTELSEEIVEALDLNISFEEQKSIEIVPERNIEAYKLLLQGKNEADKRNVESLRKSIELFQQAIAIDPNYAEAYAEVAHSIYLQTYHASRTYIEAGKLANEYLDKAEQLNPKLSRIYSVKGLIFTTVGKIDLAKSAFNKALELSPNDVIARYQFATLHYYTQEYEKQLVQAEMAYRLDPLSFASANAYFTALLTNKKFDEAEKIMKKIQSEGLENNQVTIHRSFFRLYMDKRDFEKCIHHLEKIVLDVPIMNRFLGYCYAKVGDTLNANRIIDTIRNNTVKEYKSHQLSVVYSGLQKTDSVIYHLDTIRNKRIEMIKRDRGTFFEYLEGDPKFIEVLKTHGIEK